MNKFFITLICCAMGATMISCGGDEVEGPGAGFNRQEMLLHYAGRIIIPAYTDLAAKTKALQDKASAFADNPGAATLAEAQSAWVEAYRAWQSANAFNFGPAGEQGLRKGLIEEIGTFPVAEAKIEQAINAQDHAFSSFDRDARGFLALEYLLFGRNTGAAELVQAFQNSVSRRAHLRAMSGHLAGRVQEVVVAWDTYKTSFAENKGTDAGSSTSALYNEFVRSFEAIKNFKVGLPAGKRPGQVRPEPQLVEAWYSGRSLEMLTLHFQSIERLYYGRTTDGTASGPGFKDYLETVEGGKALIASTEAQLNVVKTALAQVPESMPFSGLVAANHPAVETLHTELQRLTRFLKSDMSSLLGIAITFSSGDGD